MNERETQERRYIAELVFAFSRCLLFTKTFMAAAKNVITLCERNKEQKWQTTRKEFVRLH